MIENNKYLIFTPNGYVPFDGVRKTNAKRLKIYLSDGNYCIVSEDHKFIIDNKTYIALNLSIGNNLQTTTGLKEIIKIENLDASSVYDLLDVNGGNIYYANDILHHNCAFLGSSQTLINSKIIEHYKKVSETYNDPEEFSMQNWFAKVWHKPRKDRTYVIGCDIGEGVGGDYSIALVLDITDTARIKICATFSNNTISPTDFAYVLAKLSKKYNNAIIAGERNGIGRSTMDTIWNVYEMENILCWKGKGEAMLNPGIFSHNSIKVQACIWAKFIIDSQDLFDIEFNDKNILFEMEYFEKKANTTYSVYKAVEGKHDDYMMSLIWGLWLIEPTVAEFNFIVESVTTTKTGIPVPRIIKADNIMMDDYYNEPDEYKSSDDSSIDIDNIYSKMSGSKTKREVKEDVEFSLDDEVGFLDDIDETFDEDEFNEFGEYFESWM